MVRRYFKRRYGRRKSYRNYRRGYRRTRYSAKRVKRTSTSVLHAKRSTVATTVNFTGTAVNGGIQYTNFQFTLSDLASPSDFLNLFELCKINCVVVRITPLQNVNQYSAANSPVLSNIPIFGYAIDYDDVAAVTLAQLQEYGLYKETRFNKPVKIKIMKPRIPMAAYNQATTSFNGSVISKNQWFRTSDLQIVHYGLKTAIYNVLTNQTISYTLRATYYVTFKYIK